MILDGSGNVSERELTGLGPDQVLATELSAASPNYGTLGDAVNWYLADNQGTVRDVVQFDSTTDTTTSVDHLVYGAFGQLVSQNPSAAGDSPTFYYNGIWQDPQTALDEMGLRWYDAVDAVFASYDPLGFGGGQANLSEYVGNDPTNWWDPSGEMWSPWRWLWTGDPNASDEIYNAAMDGAGQSYTQNARDAHLALESLGAGGDAGSLAMAASLSLTLAEGKDLHAQIMNGPGNVPGGGGPNFPNIPGVPQFPGQQQKPPPGQQPPAQPPQNWGQWLNQQIQQWGPPILGIVGALSTIRSGGGDGGGQQPVGGNPNGGPGPDGPGGGGDNGGGEGGEPAGAGDDGGAGDGDGSGGDDSGKPADNTFPGNPGQVQHIFRDSPGHLPDSAANRELLREVASDHSTTLGEDKFGNTWSAKTLPNGTQVWTETRNGVIINGGLNQTPRSFNQQTGLSGN